MRVPLIVRASQGTSGSLPGFLGGVLCSTQGGMQTAPGQGAGEDPARPRPPLGRVHRNLPRLRRLCLGHKHG
jgi:hypothetical protein